MDRNPNKNHSRFLILTLIIILIASTVNAGEIFKGEVSDNEPFTVSGIKHLARYYAAAKKASILAGEDRVLVGLEDCEDLNSLKYCLDSAVDGVDDETGDPASTMEIRIIEAGPDLSVDRDISTDTPTLNEEVEVTVIITNEGNERATNVNYEDKFPAGVKVTGPNKNFAINGISWTGSLNPGESQSLSYTIVFEEFITLESTATASVIFNNKVIKKDSDTETFKVQTPYEISDSLSAKSVGLEELVTYTIVINNTDESQEISINKIDIKLPPSSAVVRKDSDLMRTDSKYTFSDKLAPGESKELFLTFKSNRKGRHELLTNAEIRVGSKTFSEELKHSIGIGVSDITPVIEFTPETVKGGGELEVEVKIVNDGSDTISGISVNMASDLLEPRGWRNIELTPGNKHYAFNKIINAPAIDEEKKFFVTLTGEYSTSSGGVMEFEETREVTVLPQEKVIEFKPIIKIDGDDINITLRVKNIAPYKLSYVSLIDTLPSGFRMIEGSRDIDIDELGIGEERTAYSYIVKAPEDYSKDSFEVTHIFNALNKDEEKIMTEKVTEVSLEKESTTTATGEGDGSEEDKTSSASGEPTGDGAITEEGSEKKPGVFKRMWSWIKGLFSKEDTAAEDETDTNSEDESTTPTEKNSDTIDDTEEGSEE